MSKKAEEAALKAYPFSKGKVVATGFGSISFDQHYDGREGFIKGYEQAEKDLALTWEDIASIIRIMFDYHLEKPSFCLTDEEICQEVLKRFNEQRKK